MSLVWLACVPLGCGGSSSKGGAGSGGQGQAPGGGTGGAFGGAGSPGTASGGQIGSGGSAAGTGGGAGGMGAGGGMAPATTGGSSATGGAGTGGASATGGAGTGGAAATGGAAGAGGAGGQRENSLSCVGLAPTCGPSGGADCCASSVVPGGRFNRDNDPAHVATVSTFRLDTYEVTVGRFRSFMAALKSGWTPAPGSGKNANNPTDPGLTRTIGLTTTAMRGPRCSASPGPDDITWTETQGDAAAESLPLNCVSWLEAFAFCIWDGGRLPSELEWNYAAAGGGDAEGQREYPWSSTTLDPSYALYLSPEPARTALASVGSKPKGNGRWGHADLSGSLSEWVSDGYQDYPATCQDCATPFRGFDRAVMRGGNYWYSSASLSTLHTWHRDSSMYPMGRVMVGARCARDP